MCDGGVGGSGVSPAATSGDAQVGHWWGIRYERTSRPVLLFGRDGQREGSPWSHGQIARETPVGTGEIPDCALALEGGRVVCNRALDRQATVGTNGEGHRGLAGRRIYCGRRRINRKARLMIWACQAWCLAAIVTTDRKTKERTRCLQGHSQI